MLSDNKSYTEKISSEHKFFSINVSELWRYRDLLLMLVKRDFITFYKQTILGPLWFILQPILITITYNFIFGTIAGISTDGLPQFVFYLSGITMWNYFSETLNKVATVFKDNSTMLGKIYFPRLILPLSIVLSGLIKFFIQFFIFIAVVLYYMFQNKIHPNSWILMSPILILLMVMLSLGIGMIISSLTTKYKDLIFLITFGIQLLMFITPVIYPSSIMSDRFKIFFQLNPLTGIFECFRYGFLGKGEFAIEMLFPSFFFSVLFLVLGSFVFNKVEKDFMDTV